MVKSTSSLDGHQHPRRRRGALLTAATATTTGNNSTNQAGRSSVSNGEPGSTQSRRRTHTTMRDSVSGASPSHEATSSNQLACGVAKRGGDPLMMALQTIQELEDKLTVVIDDGNQKDDHIKGLVEDITVARQENEELVLDIQELVMEQDHMEELVNEANHRMERMAEEERMWHDERKSLLEDIDQMRSQQDLALEVAETVKQIQASARRKMSELRIEKEALETITQQADSEIQELQEHMRNMMKENSVLKEQVASLRSQLRKCSCDASKSSNPETYSQPFGDFHSFFMSHKDDHKISFPHKKRIPCTKSMNKFRRGSETGASKASVVTNVASVENRRASAPLTFDVPDKNEPLHEPQASEPSEWNPKLKDTMEKVIGFVSEVDAAHTNDHVEQEESLHDSGSLSLGVDSHNDGSLFDEINNLPTSKSSDKRSEIMSRDTDEVIHELEESLGMIVASIEKQKSERFLKMHGQNSGSLKELNNTCLETKTVSTNTSSCSTLSVSKPLSARTAVADEDGATTNAHNDEDEEEDDHASVGSRVSILSSQSHLRPFAFFGGNGGGGHHASRGCQSVVEGVRPVGILARFLSPPKPAVETPLMAMLRRDEIRRDQESQRMLNNKEMDHCDDGSVLTTTIDKLHMDHNSMTQGSCRAISEECKVLPVLVPKADMDLVEGW